MSLPNEILTFTEAPIIDESVEKYEFHEYEPVSRTNLNTAGEIRINIELPIFIYTPSKTHTYKLMGGLLKPTVSGFTNDLLSLKSRSRGSLSPRAGYNNAWNAEVSRRFC